MLQKNSDLIQGLNTAGFISGYRGSPLGSVDQAAIKAKSFLDKYPRSKIISVIKKPETYNPTPNFIHKFRSSYFAIWDGSNILKNPTTPQRR